MNFCQLVRKLGLLEETNVAGWEEVDLHVTNPETHSVDDCPFSFFSRPLPEHSLENPASSKTAGKEQMLNDHNLDTGIWATAAISLFRGQARDCFVTYNIRFTYLFQEILRGGENANSIADFAESIRNLKLFTKHVSLELRKVDISFENPEHPGLVESSVQIEMAKNRLYALGFKAYYYQHVYDMTIRRLSDEEEALNVKIHAVLASITAVKDAISASMDQLLEPVYSKIASLRSSKKPKSRHSASAGSCYSINSTFSVMSTDIPNFNKDVKRHEMTLADLQEKSMYLIDTRIQAIRNWGLIIRTITSIKSSIASCPVLNVDDISADSVSMLLVHNIALLKEFTHYNRHPTLDEKQK